MQPIRPLFVILLFAATSLPAGTANAALGNAKSALEATGRVDLDGFGPAAPISFETDAEVDLPLDRSIVTVADAQPGLYEYFASADIGNLALKVAGSVTNGGSSEIAGFEIPMLVATAEVRDVITLSTTRTDSFDVTLELIVDGSIAAGAGSTAFANSLLQFGTDPGANSFDSNIYDVGAISDTLSITRTVSGSEINMDLVAFLSFSVFQVAAGDTVTGELNNTALIRLIVPQDVTVASSQSGTFGVVIPTPVPEPQTFLVMAAGIVLLIGAGAGRRRK